MKITLAFYENRFIFALVFNHKQFKNLNMKKLIIITTGIALLTLTSCSKEDQCSEAQAKYLEEARAAGTNAQQVEIILRKYKSKYPSCSF
jgi:hypothetical protein